MPTALFISPHLDDAVFSAGGTMAALVADGWRVVLATVFTRSMPHPTGFALRCQTDKGLAAEVDYMALRREEDASAAVALGLHAARDVHWLDLPEAPHRGYGSPAELFAGVHAGDEPVAEEVARVLRPFLDDVDCAFLPLGIGAHVDHVQVIRAVQTLWAQRGSAVPLLRWHDTPYALRAADRPAAEVTVDIDDVFDRKLAAVAAYRTQIGFQFGGEAALRTALTADARWMARPPQLAAEAFSGPATASAFAAFSANERVRLTGKG